MENIEIVQASTEAGPPNQAFHRPVAIRYDHAFDGITGGSVQCGAVQLHTVTNSQLPSVPEAIVYVPHLDSVFVTSRAAYQSPSQFMVITKLSRQDDGSWRMFPVFPHDLYMPIGGTNYDDGILFCAQDYRGLRGLRWMSLEAPHQTRKLVNTYLNSPFNSISDVVVHSDGSIWFTDPRFGQERGIQSEPQLPARVYRFDPQTRSIRAVADGFVSPDAICFSPDEQTVYITDADVFLSYGLTYGAMTGTIYAFDVIQRHGAQSLANRRVFAAVNTGIPTGIKCDTAGNVYSACSGGLNVWNPGGTLLGRVVIPGGITTFCFGRSGELFFANANKLCLLKFGSPVKGALLEGMGIDADILSGVLGPHESF